MQTFINEHPFLFGFISWTVVVSILCIANYRHHNLRKKVTSVEDCEESAAKFWDNKAMYDDLFLN